jgi:SAM-dependent methyltransferase
MSNFVKRVLTRSRERLFLLRQERRLRDLDSQFDKENVSSAWPPSPRPSINFNQSPSKSISEYVDVYLRSSRDLELPFLIDTGSLSESSCVLDFGCGLGRLASAFAIANGAYGRYFGYEPETVALDWLKSQYSKNDFFRFGGSPLPQDMNYVTNLGNLGTAAKSFEDRVGALPDPHVLANLLDGYKFDLQFSSSVFTHMWGADIVETIKSFRPIATRDAIFVNTWLIVDDFAQDALDSGAADRRLPIEVGGVLTYSHSNPLVCTAFRLGEVERIYAEAGHEIQEILYGSWSGRSNGVTYQDIVISKEAV